MFDISPAVFMFPVLFVLVFAGIPVALSLIGTAFAFGLMAYGMNLPTVFHSRMYDVTSNFILAAIPLFVNAPFMTLLVLRASNEPWLTKFTSAAIVSFNRNSNVAPVPTVSV